MNYKLVLFLSAVLIFSVSAKREAGANNVADICKIGRFSETSVYARRGNGRLLEAASQRQHVPECAEVGDECTYDDDCCSKRCLDFSSQGHGCGFPVPDAPN